MKKVKCIFMLFAVIIFMNTTHSLQASSTITSKGFKKIATGVTQIDSGITNIIYKKGGSAYVIGYDGDGGMGYGEDRIEERTVLTPSKIGEDITNIFGCLYKKGAYFLLREWIWRRIL